MICDYSCLTIYLSSSHYEVNQQASTGGASSYNKKLLDKNKWLAGDTMMKLCNSTVVLETVKPFTLPGIIDPMIETVVIISSFQRFNDIIQHIQLLVLVH